MSIQNDASVICSRVDLTKITGKTVLITGASGLIGTYLLATLAHLGEKLEVYAQVRSLPPPHTVEIVNRGNFKLGRGSLNDDAACWSLPKADLIIHCAGSAQPSQFMGRPAETFRINTWVTSVLLQKVKPGGSFLFLSSSEVYSGLEKPLLSESDIGTTTPLHPRACYIEGKRGGEMLCHTAGVRAVVARLGAIYGPGTRQGDKRALNMFIESALRYKKIEVMDSGAAQRTYGYVTDAVELLWRILLEGEHPVYNVGGISDISIGELAKKIGSIKGVPVYFNKQTTGIAGAPKRSALSLDRVEKEFQKTTYASFDYGLRETIEWQRQNLY